MNRAVHKKNRGTFQKIETAIDASVPYLLVILVIITSIDIFYAEMAETYSLQIEIIDTSVIGLFAIDLIFKYHRAKSTPRFIRENWIDIVAVIPFYLVFRLVDEFVIASELVREGQQTLHIAEGVEKEAATAAKDVKTVKIVTRSERMLREARVLGRVPKFISASRFFEKPKY